MPIEFESNNKVKAPKSSPALKLPFFNNKVTSKTRMYFTERLSLLLETGNALHPSLEVLKKQTDNPALAKILEQLIEDVSSGQSFSDSLRKHPEVFSSSYINLIAASEKGGFMDKVLKELLEVEEKREELKSTIVMALTYPTVLVFFSLSTVIFILVSVFPKFADMFASIHDNLPMTTLFLMEISKLMRHQWPLIIGLSVGGFFALSYWLKTTNGKRKRDQLLLKLPFISDFANRLYLIQTMRLMSLSISNGVGIIETLSSCKEAIPNLQFQKFLNQAEETVTEGSGIAAGFKDEKYIPPMVYQMISTGEATGNLARVMGRIADDYESEIKKQIKVFSKIAEPLLLLIMGIVVGLIVSSLILPIFSLSGAVR